MVRVSTDYTRYARTEAGEVVDKSIHKTICDMQGRRQAKRLHVLTHCPQRGHTMRNRG